jgi:hypothetical protein
VACFATTSGIVSSRSKQMLMSHARTFFYGFLQSQKNPNPGSITNLEIWFQKYSKLLVVSQEALRLGAYSYSLAAAALINLKSQGGC